MSGKSPGLQNMVYHIPDEIYFNPNGIKIAPNEVYRIANCR
jgi:hypothetical protein